MRSVRHPDLSLSDAEAILRNVQEVLEDIAHAINSDELILPVAGVALDLAGGTGTHSLLDGATHPDTVAAVVARGDLIVGDSGPLWSALPIGGVNEVLASDGVDATWTALTAGHLPDVEALNTSLTAGSVVFSDGTNLAEDNANFFWDDTNDRLGILTNTPDAFLHVQTTRGTLGYTPDSNTELRLEDSGIATNSAVLDFLSGASGSGLINFSDTDAADRFQISYDHGTDTFTLNTSGSTPRFEMNQSGEAAFGPLATVTSGYLMTFDGDLLFTTGDNTYGGTATSDDLNLWANDNVFAQANAGRIVLHERLEWGPSTWAHTSATNLVLISDDRTYTLVGPGGPVGFFFNPKMDYSAATILSTSPAFWSIPITRGSHTGTDLLSQNEGFRSEPTIDSQNASGTLTSMNLYGYSAYPVVIRTGAGALTVPRTAAFYVGSTPNGATGTTRNFSGSPTVTLATGFFMETLTQFGSTTIPELVCIDLLNQTVGTANISLRSVGASVEFRHAGPARIGATGAVTSGVDLELRGTTVLQFGSDVQLSQIAGNTLGLASGDSFRLGSGVIEWQAASGAAFGAARPQIGRPTTGILALQALDSMRAVIDANNTSTTEAFMVQHNANGASGSLVDICHIGEDYICEMFGGSASNPGTFRMWDVGNSNWVEWTTAGRTTNLTLTLPAADPTANQILESDASGNLSWIDTPSGGAGGATLTYKTANQDKTENTSVAADDDLQFTMSANTDYAFQVVAFAESDGSAPDIDFRMDAGAATVDNIRYTWSRSQGGDQGGEASDATTEQNLALAADQKTIMINGVIEVGGTGGVLSFAWAQNTSSTQRTRVERGSHMAVWEL